MSASDNHRERLRAFLQADLYLVTSQDMSCGRSTVEVVGIALAAGVRLVQLREKGLAGPQLRGLAEEVRDLTAKAGALLIINDSVELALAVGADGVHLGHQDCPVAEARIAAPDLLVGASTHSVEEAREAEQDGASYINIGPVFRTQTKSWDDEFLGLDGVRRIGKEVEVPFTVMGGIKEEHIPDLIAAGAAAIAVVTAVTAAEHPGEAAESLLSTIRSSKKEDEVRCC
jgi:thiamine-phosphate pyrophosphorylase